VVDGAVTTKKKSDYTGLAVVGLSVKQKSFFVMEAIEVRQAGQDLRDTVIRLCHEHGVTYILVESNQGGDLWHTVFHDMPVKVATFTQSEKKEVRLRRALGAYQRAGRPVRHIHRLPAYERRMVAYPHTDHDDVLDAVAAAIEHLVWILLTALGKSVTKAMVRQFSYTGD
jgi:predicted phage terminase large subunit-like protein